MRAQLEALVTQVQAFQAKTTAAVQTLTTSVGASVETLTTSVATSVENLTTSVGASVAAVEGDVATLSTTVSGLSTVAASGDFSDLTGRPSAVSAITVEAEQALRYYCKDGGTVEGGKYQDSSGDQRYKTLDLGRTAGRYCAMSKYTYTPRPQRGPRLQGTGLP